MRDPNYDPPRSGASVRRLAQARPGGIDVLATILAALTFYLGYPSAMNIAFLVDRPDWFSPFGNDLYLNAITWIHAESGFALWVVSSTLGTVMRAAGMSECARPLAVAAAIAIAAPMVVRLATMEVVFDVTPDLVKAIVLPGLAGFGVDWIWRVARRNRRMSHVHSTEESSR